MTLNPMKWLRSLIREEARAVAAEVAADTVHGLDADRRLYETIKASRAARFRSDLDYWAGQLGVPVAELPRDLHDRLLQQSHTAFPLPHEAADQPGR